jgi:signal transduction histidine kinase
MESHGHDLTLRQLNDLTLFESHKKEDQRNMDITPSLDGLFIFEEEKSEQLGPEKQSHCWKVLIVDDEPGVHEATQFALSNCLIHERPLEFRNAYSANEALAILKQEHDIALMLLDVVMEEKDSGLKLVQHVREGLGNRRLQIILRTGQPGDAPEDSVVELYDINDYKLKTELTRERMFTCVTLALRAFRDITQRDYLQEELKKSNELLKEWNATLEQKVRERTLELEENQNALASSLADNITLLRTLSHDLKNFCTAILMRCESAAKATDGRVQNDFNRILDQAKRMMEFIGRVNTWEGLRAGKISPVLIPCRLENLLRECVEVFEKKAQEKNVSLSISWKAPNDCEVLAESSTFSVIVLNNLVSNAIKFCSEGQSVELIVDGKVGPQVVQLQVKDSGIGIPAEILENLFSPKKKTSRVGTGGERGSGFGMPLVREYLESMGGKISVVSVSSDDETTQEANSQVNSSILQPHGTTFTLLLPCP